MNSFESLPVARRPLVTISVPVFNEQESIPELLKRLRELAERERARCDFEFLFTDDGSTDRTFDMLAEAAKSDHRIRVLSFSRNYGFQRSVLTNYLHARGDAAVQIDADLQDPPELVSTFIDHWLGGRKVVYGVRTRRQEGALMQGARKLFYRLLAKLSDTWVPPDAGDFRLIDRVIIEHLRSMSDRSIYLRGVIAGFGYPQIGIDYERPQRFAGTSKFNFSRLTKLAIDGITSQSTRPLHYITLFGFGLCALTAILSTLYLVSWAMGYAGSTPGFTTLVLLQLFAIGMQAVFLGVIGEYVARIFDNVRHHPMVIVERIAENGIVSEAKSSAAATQAPTTGR